MGKYLFVSLKCIFKLLFKVIFNIFLFTNLGLWPINTFKPLPSSVKYLFDLGNFIVPLSSVCPSYILKLYIYYNSAFKMYTLMSFDKYLQSYNHHQNQDIEDRYSSINPKGYLCPVLVNSSPHPNFLATDDLFYVLWFFLF